VPGREKASSCLYKNWENKQAHCISTELVFQDGISTELVLKDDIGDVTSTEPSKYLIRVQTFPSVSDDISTELIVQR
jgi:hypothetical protein